MIAHSRGRLLVSPSALSPNNIDEEHIKIDPQLNAERQAARKNRKQEQRYPLFHHAGILEQIVERWTAERHLALQAACREALADSLAEGMARAFAHTELYMDVCHELTDEEQMCAWTLRCNTAGFPKRPHYIANFWYERLKEALGLEQSCTCGGIWVCGLHQPRRRGETTHIFDWYCADCQRSSVEDGSGIYRCFISCTWCCQGRVAATWTRRTRFPV